MALRRGENGSQWFYFAGKAPDLFLMQSRCPGQDVFPVYALTDAGVVIGCDAVISALGVEPARGPAVATTPPAEGLKQEGGWLSVDSRFRTSAPGIYAAGDGCDVHTGIDRRSPEHSEPGPPEWLQMRLWSQAKTMGQFAARNMLEDWETGGCAPGQAGWSPYTADPSMSSSFPFQLFTHVTRFFGFKVILLGR